MIQGLLAPLRDLQARTRVLESRNSSLVSLTNRTGGALVHGDIVAISDSDDGSVEVCVALEHPWALTFTINVIIDGGGAEITLGIKGDLQVDFACTLQSATILADQVGSIVIDIWKDTYGAYPPVDVDSITAAAPPTLVADEKSTDAVLAGWNTAIVAGNTLRFNVDSVNVVTRVVLALKAVRV